MVAVVGAVVVVVVHRKSLQYGAHEVIIQQRFDARWQQSSTVRCKSGEAEAGSGRERKVRLEQSVAANRIVIPMAE